MGTASALKAAKAALKAAEEAEAALEAEEAAPAAITGTAVAAPTRAPIEDAALAAVAAAIDAARSGDKKNVDALRARAHDLVDKVTRV